MQKLRLSPNWALFARVSHSTVILVCCADRHKCSSTKRSQKKHVHLFSTCGCAVGKNHGWVLTMTDEKTHSTNNDKMIECHVVSYTVHSTLYTAHCTLHTAHCTLYIAHCTLYTAHCTLYTAHCTLHTARCTLHTAHCTLYTAHCTLYTVHCTLHWLVRLASAINPPTVHLVGMQCPAVIHPWNFYSRNINLSRNGRRKNMTLCCR